jgi:phage-related minor tail protein
LNNDDTELETWTVAITADTGDLETKLRAATGAGRQFSSALTTAFDGLAIKGKSLGDVLSGLALSLSKMVLQAALKPLDQGLNSIFSCLLSGAGIGGGASAPAGLPTPFATGGVIQSPVSFPLSAGRTGIAGERGAEAILPLARGPDGRLGVASSGGGSGVNVTFNVQATDAESFARSQTQIAALLSRTVAMGQRNL